MKKVAGLAIVFCALASGQSAPNNFHLPDKLTNPAPDLLQQRLKSMTLLNGPLRLMPNAQMQPKDTVCAIPLLNALPANGNKVDYKIRVLPPPANSIDHMAVAKAIPACPKDR